MPAEKLMEYGLEKQLCSVPQAIIRGFADCCHPANRGQLCPLPLLSALDYDTGDTVVSNLIAGDPLQ